MDNKHTETKYRITIQTASAIALSQRLQNDIKEYLQDTYGVDTAVIIQIANIKKENK